jgi:hypothetical protein
MNKLTRKGGKTMVRKPQQLTLSIRISDSLRDFLETSKGVIANRRCGSVSISDVAFSWNRRGTIGWISGSVATSAYPILVGW